jgi:hypothetical protein
MREKWIKILGGALPLEPQPREMNLALFISQMPRIKINK